MSSPRRPVSLLRALVVGLVLVLLAGCSSDSDTPRPPGDPVSDAESQVLAQVLARNVEEGGADFVVTAPYADGAVLTLTGEVDFTQPAGRAQAVTTFDDGRPDDTRTLFFTDESIWFGDVPGLAEAVAQANLPEVSYVRRPLGGEATAGNASLVDVLLTMVLRLASDQEQDPRSFSGYTWQSSELIDGELASRFSNGQGTTVAVAADSELLVQYIGRITDQEFDVTITLSDHGPVEITLPSDEETLSATEYPEIAAALGV
ncbi:hypothetical protein [Modestobacter roseus]|uniref:Lipoprotein LprG n=1 Tax=Modestobacter roseus TaxID=1181884 RepID=A0A562IV99_9ACTN|nr:hypothetical protein [Modestobacter roseus]MQA33460.1 hypothetical protein [Modestobacter roseus]TWH74951.1 hypothetical protein JD78_03498 [Modestobacter roseus]